MTNEPESQPSSSPGSDDEILHRRLDQARAELTGHVPPPDQRLEAMFLTDQAPVDPPGDLAETIELKPASAITSAPSPRRRLAITAIAASFVLLMGLAAYAAGRSKSDSPVEIAGDTAAASGEATAVGSDDPAASGSDSLATAAGEDPDLDQPAADSDASDTADEGRRAILGPDLAEQMRLLWLENRDWVDCVTGAIDAWAESSSTDGDDSGELQRGLDLVDECGAPSLDDLELPEFSIPDIDELELPDFAIPGLDGEDLCDKIETDNGTEITCHLPDGSWFDDFEGLDGFEWREFLEQLPGFDRFERHFDHRGTDGGRWQPADPDAPAENDAGA